MDTDPVTVRASDGVETVVRLLHEHQVPGLAGRRRRTTGSSGIVTENDLLLYDEQEDVEPPPHLQIMGGVIYLGSVKHWEERVAQVARSHRRRPDDERSGHRRAGRDGARGRAPDPEPPPQPASRRRRRRAAARRRYARRRARSAARRRSERSARGVRARALVDLAASPQRPRAWPARPAARSSARSSRPTPTGTAWCPSARAALEGGAAWLAVATARGGARAARRRASTGACS